MTATCWADVLTRAERYALAEKLGNACTQLPELFDEMSDLHADVTEREVERYRAESLGRHGRPPSVR